MDETGLNLTKNSTPNISQLCSIYFWNPIANVTVKVHYEKTLIENLKHSWKKFLSTNEGNYTRQYNEVKEELWPVSFIYVWSLIEHQVKDIYATKKIQGFFEPSQARNTFEYEQVQ